MKKILAFGGSSSSSSINKQLAVYAANLVSDSSIEDQEILGHLMLVAGKVAEQLNLDNTFRIVINNGAKAGQSVFHLHLHLLSGRSLNWPPG